MAAESTKSLLDVTFRVVTAYSSAFFFLGFFLLGLFNILAIGIITMQHVVLGIIRRLVFLSIKHYGINGDEELHEVNAITGSSSDAWAMRPEFVFINLERRKGA